MRQLIAWGADGLITDRPDVAMAVLSDEIVDKRRDKRLGQSIWIVEIRRNRRSLNQAPATLGCVHCSPRSAPSSARKTRAHAVADGARTRRNGGPSGHKVPASRAPESPPGPSARCRKTAVARQRGVRSFGATDASSQSTGHTASNECVLGAKRERLSSRFCKRAACLDGENIDIRLLKRAAEIEPQTVRQSTQFRAARKLEKRIAHTGRPPMAGRAASFPCRGVV
jgi:hypothetical protein